MNLKTDWTSYLHKLREREILLIFEKCAKGTFNSGLEVGAGDGFQSTLLSNYIRELVCTEYDQEKLKKYPLNNVKYMICDAEIIDKYFEPKRFDIIFSSNLLEHLIDREGTLKAMSRIMKDDGLMIHSMPNIFWKISHILFFYPNKVLERIGFITTRRKRETRTDGSLDFQGENEVGSRIDRGNNLKSDRKRNSRLYKALPAVHGEYRNNLVELLNYRNRSWIKLFERANYKVVKMKRLTVSSGYGFGLDRLRHWLEKLGLSTTNAYICVKNGNESRWVNYWKAK